MLEADYAHRRLSAGKCPRAHLVESGGFRYLAVRLNLSEQGDTVWFQDMMEKRYRHLTQDSWTALCDDPNEYLNLFGPAHYSTWVDGEFDRDFTRANATLDPAERMSSLAACEAQLMKTMPVIPLFHDTWTSLEAPYLRGLKPNPFACPRFKYAWIDTNWRPS